MREKAKTSIDTEDADIRLRFHMSLDENPALAKALLNAKKGRARNTRLMVLASIGLVAERGGIDKGSGETNIGSFKRNGRQGQTVGGLGDEAMSHLHAFSDEQE
jgi:hypothetical protein